MRRIVIFLVAVAAALAGTTVAWAHEEINPKQFPTGQPTFFTLNAANEKEVDLTKVTLNAPANVKFGAATHEPAGWTVDRKDTTITWSGGAVKPAHFEQWGYEIDSADQPGTLTYKVTMGYADGKSEDVNVQTTAVAAGAAPTTVVTTPAGAATTVAATTATTAPAKSSASSARSRANVALGLGIGAAVLSLVALGLAARRRSAGGPGAPATPGGGQKQDW